MLAASSPRRGGFVLVAGALLLSGLATACSDQGASVNDPNDQGANMKTVVIPVEGMSCMACVARVKKTLTSIAGVGDVPVDLAERNARVRFDPSLLAPDRLVAAINGLGYHAGAPAEAQ